MRAGVRVLALVGALGSAACAARPFDRHLEAQRWSDAARAFAVDPALQADERALYRAALLHASPDLETYDADRAAALFARVLAVSRDAGRRETARRFVALLEAMRSAHAEAARRERDARTEIDRLTAEIERLQGRVGWFEARLGERDELNGLLNGILSRLEADLREHEAQLRVLRHELNGLKEIDLKRSPRPTVPAGAP